MFDCLGGSSTMKIFNLMPPSSDMISFGSLDSKNNVAIDWS
jgi:hypothetical protein